MHTALSLELELPETKLLEAFGRLSAQRRTELLAKLQALAEPELRTVPASKSRALVGLVSLGGDAMMDTEALYGASALFLRSR